MKANSMPRLNCRENCPGRDIDDQNCLQAEEQRAGGLLPEPDPGRPHLRVQRRSEVALPVGVAVRLSIAEPQQHDAPEGIRR